MEALSISSVLTKNHQQYIFTAPELDRELKGCAIYGSANGPTEPVMNECCIA